MSIESPRLKQEAISLRKKGLTYSEILEKIPVAKSTLSIWLRSVKLAKKQKQRITEKRRKAQLRGAKARKKQRLAIEKKLVRAGLQEVGSLTKRDLFLIGTALYWAEGSKQTVKYVSQGVIFSNSDPGMIQVFLRWLEEICNIPEKDIAFELYIHQSGDKPKAINFWVNKLNIPPKRLTRIYLKHHKPLKKINKKKEYHGLLRVRVNRSTSLNRKIKGWAKGIQLGVV